MTMTQSPEHWNPEPATGRGQILIVRSGQGKDFWQPVPANGQISVRISPDFVDVESPFSVGTQTLPSGGHVREHSHPEHDEVLHIIRGHGKAVIDGGEHVMEPDMTIFVGRKRRHMFINDSDTELHWLWFIQPNGLEHFFEEVGRPVEAAGGDPTPFPRPDNVLEIEARTAFAPQPDDQRKLE